MKTDNSAKFSKNRLHILFLTWGGCGLLRPAPGTWGTLGALPLVALLLVTGGAWALLGAAVFLSLMAKIVIDRYEKEENRHDDSRIVIDEVIGVSLAFLPAHMTGIDFLAGFALFRLFDALKPGPIGWIDERVPGAWGVILDDVLAGLLTALCLIGVHYVGGAG